MRRFVTVLTVAALALPFAASALSQSEVLQQIQALLQQITALQTQIETLKGTSGGQSTVSSQPSVGSTTAGREYCSIVNTLALGDSGSEVLALQRYLITQGALSEGAASGTFDLSTESAVQKWQTSRGIVSSGTPATTGYGVFGPRSRSLTALECTLSSSSSATSACPLAPQPTSPCAGTWSAITTANGCTTAWQCAVPLPTVQQNACSSVVSLMCPTGTRVQVGPNCAQTCVSGTDSAATTPFAATPSSGSMPLTVTFTAYGVASDIYSINFGDGIAGQMTLQSCNGTGTTSCNYTTTHVYWTLGTFTATFTGSRDGQVSKTFVTVR